LDFIDLAVAGLGGLVLLALFWKLGGLSRLREESDPFVRLLGYLKEGESSRVEFKSTVRLNLKTGKPGKEIELAWLKAVVAFLNSEGGALILGVDDSGQIVGVEQDGFENPDKLQLHLKNLINQHIGAEFSRYIRITPVEVDSHLVVLIECKPCPEPVFLKMGKNEEFYIRSGPSSVKLSPSQTVAYVLQTKKVRS
jgi:predicted HTH transcriptional regulator